MKKPELLSPAGNLEKLKIAVIYGADAVYCGGHKFGLREGADNFSHDELIEGTRFAHKNGCKIYITVNMMPHNEDLETLPSYLHQLEKIGVDGLIISDPGVYYIIKNEEIDLPLHLSTQANTVNWASANFWDQMGFDRVILARELSEKEIREIGNKSDVGREIFIHGSMCISYSGRCLLSNYLASRDANKGKCAHSCRWKYHLMEEKRPGEYFPIFEDENGSYIMNSKDLCLIEYIPKIINLEVDSLKIEGRMKSLHYVATVTSVYRKAIDDYYDNPEGYKIQESWLDELKKVSHRKYTTGFFQSPPDQTDHNYESSSYIRDYDFMGVVRDFEPETGLAEVEVRNKFFKGDEVEIFGPDCLPYTITVDYIINEEGEKVETAPHPKELIKIPVENRVGSNYIIRRKKKEGNNGRD